MSAPAPRSCVVCGREITWRRKWARDWESVKYCSKSCRSSKLSDRDTALEKAILDLLARRTSGATICPSEAARTVDAERWRALMEPVRRAARRLVDAGRVEITQQGHVVDPSRARGPIRIRAVRVTPAPIERRSRGHE